MSCSGGAHLRVRPLAFASGSALSLASGRRPLFPHGPAFPGTSLARRCAAVSSGGRGLAGARRLSGGLTMPLVTGLVGPRGGVAFGLQAGVTFQVHQIAGFAEWGL